MVLYPRCAHNYLSDPTTFTQKYYMENTRLYITMFSLPAAIWGGAHAIISALYPSRYAQSAPVLQAFMLRASLLALASPSEDMLIATGESQVILIGNLLRSGLMLTATLGAITSSAPPDLFAAPR
jgi:O-antigen/teichoic acid export membrane protein